MSRVQKKPIRRKLKDASSKTEEPNNMPERVEPTPEEVSSKSGIPRKPRPEITPKEETDKPVRRVSRISASRAAGEEEEGRSERRRPVRSRSPAEGRDGGNRSERDGSTRSERDGSTRSERDGGNRSERDGSTRSERNGSTRSERNGGNRSERDGSTRSERNGGRGGRKPAEKKKRPEKIVYEKTKQFVFPGEAVSTIEEYRPGFGTVNDDGTIRSTVMGVVGINNEHRMITIIPKTKTLNTITEGDIVLASITDVRESNARVDLVAAEKSLDEEIVNKGNAEIYVSNIKDGFAKSVADEFCVGDIVRAKVIDSAKIGLSTVDSDLGVLKAYCSKCKTPLTRDGDVLVCSNCGNRERRKLADGYGKGIAPMP